MEIKGLTQREIEEKRLNGKTNRLTIKTDESVKDIIKKNLFTYFNLIFLIIAILLLIARSYRNLSFLPVIIINILIGIIQQVRSKKVLDKLTLLDKNKYKTYRDGKMVDVSSDDLVEGDYIILESGSQIPADGVIIDGRILVNESLLTGEENEIEKINDSNLMSGSFVTSGRATVRLTNVGDESYSAKLMRDTKTIKETKSEMINSIDNFVKIAGIMIIPIGILLFFESFIINHNSFTVSVTSMVSAVIGMIPEGLYLLTTIALALSTIRLSNKKVLLHDMKSIESLARVDVLCVDKTGTITNNKMNVIDIFDMNGKSINDLDLLTRYVNTIEDKNITMDALREKLNKTDEKLNYLEKSDFNSKDKYSKIVLDNVTYKLGAPDILLNDTSFLNQRISNGERILAFVKEENGVTNPILFISLKNEIRKNAKEIFNYFKENEVEIKVISGDNPKAVSYIAKEAGIDGYDKYIDLSDYKSYDDIKKTIQENTIFGRVKPEQKRMIIKALKEEDKKVAMTGDGVNDILAMKEADCSISVGSGADAARDVSQVVLLDNDFSKMKDIVYEGRKNINNITRSASLFIYKNMFSFLLAIYSIIFMTTYPLEPTQVSLGAAFTIGIPGFFLTFEENQKKQKGKFMKQVILMALPAAITSFLAIVFMVEFSNLYHLKAMEISTSCAYLFFTGGFLILYQIIKPLNKYRLSVMVLCIVGMILTILFVPDFFAIQSISIRSICLVILFALAEFTVIRWLYSIENFICDKIFKEN